MIDAKGNQVKIPELKIIDRLIDGRSNCQRLQNHVIFEDLLMRIWKSYLFYLKGLEFIPNNLGNKLIGEEIMLDPQRQDVISKSLVRTSH